MTPKKRAKANHPKVVDGVKPLFTLTHTEDPDVNFYTWEGEIYVLGDHLAAYLVMARTTAITQFASDGLKRIMGRAKEIKYGKNARYLVLWDDVVKWMPSRTKHLVRLVKLTDAYDDCFNTGEKVKTKPVQQTIFDDKTSTTLEVQDLVVEIDKVEPDMQPIDNWQHLKLHNINPVQEGKPYPDEKPSVIGPFTVETPRSMEVHIDGCICPACNEDSIPKLPNGTVKERLTKAEERINKIGLILREQEERIEGQRLMITGLDGLVTKTLDRVTNLACDLIDFETRLTEIDNRTSGTTQMEDRITATGNDAQRQHNDVRKWFNELQQNVEVNATSCLNLGKRITSLVTQLKIDKEAKVETSDGGKLVKGLEELLAKYTKESDGKDPDRK